MNLPNRDQAVVPLEKLRDYLLSLSHPVGHSKAVFFRALGYDENNLDRLTEALLKIAQAGDVRDTIATDYGVKYVIPGELAAPSGQTTSVLTVWIVDQGQSAPRLVTAYPAGEEEES